MARLDTKPDNGEKSEPQQEVPQEKGCHMYNESLLCSNIGFNNYQGVFSWSLIVLIVIHILLTMENFAKYGLLVNPLQILSYIQQDPYNWPACYLIIGSFFLATPSVFLERFMTKGHSQEVFGTVITYMYLLLLIVFPTVMVSWLKSITPVGSLLTLAVYTILCLKLISYHVVNGWHREDHPKNVSGALRKPAEPLARQPKKKERGQIKVITYPLNLTLPDMLYFVLAPTLCYEVNFPMTREIRVKFLLFRSLEIVMLFNLMLGIVQQWIMPVVKTSMKPLHKVEASYLFEYLLKLAIPTHYIWIIFFYFFFHSYLNFMGELMCFGDREFYLDWWNAESPLQFWSRWNRPAHRWLVRHLYKPLRLHGVEKLQAQIAVFMASSLIYEYIMSVPLKMFRFWVLLSMMIQMPLSWTLERVFGGKYGNIVMWLNSILGTPLIILLYWHDYYLENQSSKTGWGLY
ncbi:diacylglycerol O-acyltransferase 1-like isoform 2-T2 [Discoglossus pictus]